MWPLILSILLGCALAAPDGRGGHRGVFRRVSSDEFSHVVVRGGGGGYGVREGGGVVGGGGYGRRTFACGRGQADDGTGRCVDADVTRNIFVYAAPKFPVSYGPTPYIPKPKIEYNVVFVRTPEHPYPPDPIVVPPPRQKTIVYVLTRKGHVDQKVIQVPGDPTLPPDVFYVNYNDGDNLDLAGISLSDVLSQQGQAGQVIGGGGLGGGIIGGGGGGVGLYGGTH